MKCYCCGADNWFSLDKPNEKFHSQREMGVCRGCGNLAHKVEPQDEEKILEFYRKDYRPAPTVANIITTTHKQNYIMLPKFLGGFLKGKSGLRCLDIGCATGYMVGHLRRLGHKATGCEYTLTYRRAAEHFYGVPITEKPQKKHPQDLITLYHVLEHLTEPDVKLAEYAALLGPEGRMFISVPEWLDVIEEASGSAFQNFEHLFHKDHINLFTNQSVKNLFHRCGLIIESEDRITYGQTYLLRKARPGEAVPGLVVEDWRQVVEKVVKQKVAIDLYLRKKYNEAAIEWPRFPEAYIQQIFGQHGKDPTKQQDLFDQALAVLPANTRLKGAYAMWLLQHQRYPEAINVYQYLLEHRPAEDVLFKIGECYLLGGKKKEAMPYYDAAWQMNPQLWTDCMNRMMHIASTLPTWDEVAEEQIKEQFIKANRKNIGLAPIDPLIDNGNEPASAGQEPGQQPVAGEKAQAAA